MNHYWSNQALRTVSGTLD